MSPSETQEGEEFGVRLRWPADPVGEPLELGAPVPGTAPAPSPAPAESDAPPRAASPPEQPWSPPDREAPRSVRAGSESKSAFLEDVATASAEGVPAALATIAARVDSLAAVTTTFRNVVSDRLSEYTERVATVAAGPARELEGYRAAQEQLAGEVRASLRHLTGAVEDVASELASFQQDVRAELAAIAGEVQALRRRTSVRARPLALDDDQVRQVADAVAEALGGQPSAPPSSAARRRRPARS